MPASEAAEYAGDGWFRAAVLFGFEAEDETELSIKPKEHVRVWVGRVGRPLSYRRLWGMPVSTIDPQCKPRRTAHRSPRPHSSGHNGPCPVATMQRSLARCIVVTDPPPPSPPHRRAGLCAAVRADLCGRADPGGLAAGRSSRRQRQRPCTTRLRACPRRAHRGACQFYPRSIPSRFKAVPSRAAEGRLQGPARGYPESRPTIRGAGPLHAS